MTPRPPLSVLFVALFWSALMPSAASAQRYFGFEGTYGYGSFRAFEVLVQADGTLEICLPSYPGALCEGLSERELAELEPRVVPRDGDVALTFVVDETPGTIALSLAGPFEGRVMGAILTQCFYAAFAGEPLYVCSLEEGLRRILATASRLAAALAGSDFRVMESSIFTGDPTDASFDNAISLATLEAMSRPRASVSIALTRLVRRGELSFREGEVFDGHPPALARALEAARVAWFADMEGDHMCSRTCGGCLPLSDYRAALEESGVPAALEMYEQALDDALWARGVSVWALDDASATALVRGVQRSAVESACGPSNWGRPRYRRCAVDTLRAAAEAAAGAARGRSGPSLRHPHP